MAADTPDQPESRNAILIKGVAGSALLVLASLFLAHRSHGVCNIEGCDLEPPYTFVLLGVPAYLAGTAIFFFTGWRLTSTHDSAMTTAGTVGGFAVVVLTVLMLGLGILVLRYAGWWAPRSDVAP